jgi:hypothetical protein
MNIQCKWYDHTLSIYRGEYHYVGMVYNDSVLNEPSIMLNEDETLTFTEIEHIMDCWENMPKN